MLLNITPPQAAYFLDQIVLSITVCSMAENIFMFSSAYSYPLPLHNRLSKNMKLNSFEKIVSIHYFNMFYYDNWKKSLNKLNDFDKKSEKYKWLCESIDRYNMPHQKIAHFYMLKVRKVEQKFLQLHISKNQ